MHDLIVIREPEDEWRHEVFLPLFTTDLFLFLMKSLRYSHVEVGFRTRGICKAPLNTKKKSTLYEDA